MRNIIRIHRGNLPPRPVSIPTTLDDSGSGYCILLINIYPIKMRIICIAKVGLINLLQLIIIIYL